jgi:uncharacterized protein (TIGR03435 family)
MKRVCLAIALCAIASAASKAQSFEAAMFRLEDPNNKIDYNRPDAPNQNQKYPSNRLIEFHIMLKSLIAQAWDIRYQNILNGPAWIDSQHYDLSAKVEGDGLLTKVQMRPMVRSLLEERVHLAVHIENRIVPGYALVLAKGGSKLKPNTGAPFFGMFNNFQLKSQNSPAESIAQSIEFALKQPVVNETGLPGNYDYELKFAPDTADNPAYSGFPTIFTAVEEQLGLKLEPRKVPRDYLIIDHVDRAPTEN